MTEGESRLIEMALPASTRCCTCVRRHLASDSCQRAGESRLRNGIDFSWRPWRARDSFARAHRRGGISSTTLSAATPFRHAATAATAATTMAPFFPAIKGKNVVVAQNLRNFRKRENVFSLEHVLVRGGSARLGPRLLNEPSVTSADPRRIIPPSNKCAIIRVHTYVYTRVSNVSPPTAVLLCETIA